MKSNITFAQRLPNPAIYILPPILVTGFLWLTTANDVSVLQVVAAFALFLMPWATYRKWRTLKQTEVPIFAMITGIYWLYYVLPLFWGDRYAVSFFKQGLEIPDEAITSSILLAVAGLTAFWLGMRTGVGQRLVPRTVPDIPLNPMRWDWLRVLLLLGTFASLSETAMYTLGIGMNQTLLTLITFVPTVAYTILLRNYLRGQATRGDKILIILFLSLRVLIGMASGWMGALGFLMITTGAVYLYERKKFPIIFVTVLVTYVLFFQVGKFAMREKYWYGQEEGSKVERIAVWVEASFQKWGEALSDPSGQQLRELAYASLSRTALLKQTANVMELTPNTVPYQYGQTYSYMFIAFIPRLVWPDKPSANDANRFYQVAYGVTAEEDLDTASYAIGVLTEGYINFGWPGTIGIMFLLGIFFDWFQWTFMTEQSGYLLRGIGVTLLPYFLGIEDQLAVQLGATLQRVLLIIFLMLPIIRLRKINKGFFR